MPCHAGTFLQAHCQALREQCPVSFWGSCQFLHADAKAKDLHTSQLYPHWTVYGAYYNVSCSSATSGNGLSCGQHLTLLQSFLRANGLKLILRSHEGPDARAAKLGMGKMLEGFSLDHQVAAGCLCTVFR